MLPYQVLSTSVSHSLFPAHYRVCCPIRSSLHQCLTHSSLLTTGCAALSGPLYISVSLTLPCSLQGVLPYQVLSTSVSHSPFPAHYRVCCSLQGVLPYQVLSTSVSHSLFPAHYRVCCSLQGVLPYQVLSTSVSHSLFPAHYRVCCPIRSSLHQCLTHPSLLTTGCAALSGPLYISVSLTLPCSLQGVLLTTVCAALSGPLYISVSLTLPSPLECNQQTLKTDRLLKNKQ